MPTIFGMRRMPRGGTTHPQSPRPGNGYGRPLVPGPARRLSPIRLEMGALSHVVGLWAADVDLAAAERSETKR